MKNYVIIKLVSGMKYGFPISTNEPYHSVSRLKMEIEKFLDIPKQSQRLLYMGSSLHNDFNLVTIPNKSILHLVTQMATIDE